jgi:hypothetical protein
MATVEQLKDRERLRRHIEREALTAVMSNAKWGRLQRALAELAFPISFRRRDVRDVGPDPGYWDRDKAHVHGGLLSIEWLDISARHEQRRGQLVAPTVHDRTGELRAALLAANVPFSVVERNVRVWGYLRPGVSPQWEIA